MESEKVKEIKKALECCSSPTCTSDCPLSGYHSNDYKTLCRDKLVKDSLTLINELESENERLILQYERVKADSEMNCLELKDRIAELEKENARLANRITCKVVFPDEKLEEIKKRCIENVYADVKDTLTEFAERLKGKRCMWETDKQIIDETLKEFIEND